MSIERDFDVVIPDGASEDVKRLIQKETDRQANKLMGDLLGPLGL